ncbi:MAG: diguanylate cyclase (GGDEF)-like protein [Oleiphilaceae bacterium]|jgi:diguanylate cyclase (GGDEF)-like protein
MKVLVVDDQRSIRMISVSVAKSLGHETIEAACGQDAIDICASEKVDLILMDVEMPGINGFETTKKIRAQTTTWFPIIFVSAKTDPKFFVEGIQSGGDIYLFKPIIPDVLESMIKAMHRIAAIQEELHSTKVKMELLAHQDKLTGLVNRRGFDNAVSLEFKRAQQDKSSLALIMVDIDHFKPFNDHYGHQAGDDCLAIVSETLKDVMCRPNDIVARYGGEEFAVILPNTNSENAVLVGARIVSALKKLAYPHEYSSVTDYVTVSGGISEITNHETLEDMIKSADKALYRVKASGRNKILP